MNHIHSLIWNPITRSYGPTPELAYLHKGRNSKLILALAIAAVASGAQAAPTGGDVVSGGATISVNGTTTAIDQSTDAVTINWQGFDIDADETVTFSQPDANSLALNRVLSGNGTEIQGQLNANGRVFILDANGVLFGETAQVNVGSLVASTLDMTSADFANNHFEFSGSGSPATVTNLGHITVADSGAVALLGGQVINNGVIRARLGNVALAAGNQITLDFAGDGLLNVKIDEGTAQALVQNGGLIQADGGSVLMTAHASDALLQTVVNNTGVIEARTLQEQDGKIMLLGGFNGGNVKVGGKLDASAPDGGDGGFIETSGAVVKIQSDLRVTTDAPEGQTGMWLIDPTDIEVSYEGVNDNVSHASTQALQNSLATTNITVETQPAGAQPGDITIVDPIFWASGNSLTLDAHNNIAINNYIHAPNGGLVLDAGNNITTGVEGHLRLASFELIAGNWSQVTNNLPIFNVDDFVLTGGTFTRALAGNGAGAPWEITDVYGLQGLVTTLDANAVLVNNLDASAAVAWNTGAGFQPIGTLVSAFTGDFDGNGFFIHNLTINRPGQSYVGLFGYTTDASITNLGLENLSVVGNAVVGGLVGEAVNTNIANIAVSGSVTANGVIAGGLGGVLLNNSVLINSYSTASVSSNGEAGGLIGYLLDADIATSYASGEVLGVGNYQGGLVGYYNSGNIDNSYWDTDTTGQATGVGVDSVGVNITNLNPVSGNVGGNPSAYEAASYGNLDLINSWFIAEGSSRPMLRAFLSGDGSISNLYQLQGMAADLAGTYTLTNNIDATATASTDNADIWGGRGFAPVGISGGEFTGSLDGQGFVINGLTINRPDQDYVGLFGSASNTATLTGIGLEGGAISGNNLVGALVGWNGGGVTTSYATGAVNGNGIQIGGLVGFNQGDITTSYATGAVDATSYVGGLVGWNNSTISSSYATGAVEGTDHVGGLAGYNNGTITTIYATGAAQGTDRVGGLVGFNNGIIASSYATGAVDGTTDVGGLVGRNMNAVNTSYWDGHSTGMGATGVGSSPFGGFSATQVNGNWATLVPGDSAYSADNYGSFDFATTWFISEGFSRPMLRAFLSGGGAINNLYDLQGMAADLGGIYTLMADIDASATAASVAQGKLLTPNYSDTWGGRGFAPVGVNGDGFTGSLNGAGFVIDGLTINRPDQDDIGLIGFGNGSNLTRVMLDNVAVIGDSGVGALMGRGNATISQSSATGSVAGGMVVGGLVGSSLFGSISESYASVITSGADRVGGLVGVNSIGSSVVNSYSDSVGSVTSLGSGGGLVGFNAFDGTITQSYSLSSVNAAGDAGGLVAVNDGTIVDSFWNTEVLVTGVAVGDDTGTTGLTSAEFKQLASFASWGADIDDQGGTGAIWRIYENRSAPLLRAFLPEVDVIAYDDTQIYDGGPYQGLHQINGTSGNGVRYGNNYAEFLAVFGENGTPYGVEDHVGSSDLEYIGDSQGAVNAGTYNLTLSELWSDQLGYDIVLNDGTLTITPAEISVTVTIDDATKIYGNADPAFSWAVTDGDLADGDTLTGTLTREPGEDVGNYTIFGNVNGDLASGNYTVTLNEGTLTITPRDIVIDIASLDKIYGDADPEFTWAVTSGGLVEGDELSGTLTRAPGENVGDYTISGVVDGDLANGNYTYSLNNGLLTISPRPLVLTADNLMKIYGEEDPELTWSITDGSVVGDDTLMVSVSREDGSNVGTYTIMLDASGDATNSNYELSLVDGQLQITPAGLTVTANDVTSYWDLLPAFTASIDGLVNGDTEASVFGDSLSVISNLVIPVPGNYVLSPVATLIGENYQVSFVNGLLTLLSSNPGGNYIEALTSTQLPAREALGRERISNIYEGRALLDGSEDDIVLHVLDGGVRLDPETLAAFGIVFPDAVNFPVNSAVVDERFFGKLRDFVQQLKQYPNVQVLVEGHTSSTGSLALNQRLSERRADAVAKILQDLGLESRRIRTEHFNYQRPVATNETAEGRYLNQRTEMVEDKQKQQQR